MSFFLKIFEAVLNFTSLKSQSITRRLLDSVRKMFAFVIIACGSMALFCVGISIMAQELVRQSNLNQEWALSKSLLIGGILSLVTLSVLGYCLSKKTWLKTVELKTEFTPTGPSPVEEALGLLIKDFVSERQLKRSSPPAQAPTQAPPPGQNP